jgi:phosphomannomutase
MDVDAVLKAVEKAYAGQEVITIDGVKIILGNEWVHLRKSNTEPIIRIYAESSCPEKAAELAGEVINKIQTLT